MKLSEAQITRTLSVQSASACRRSSGSRAILRTVWHHTFFLDDRGLHVLELLEVPGMEAQDGEMISIADWSDGEFTRLTTHQPEPTGVVIRLKEVQH
jgi:hypothetical protein